jgi:hypothetical protein
MNATIDDPFSLEIAPVCCGLSALAAPLSEQSSDVNPNANTASSVSKFLQLYVSD